MADPLVMPNSAREGSMRGQSRKYLQQTLNKLGEDSLRIGRRLNAGAAWSPTSLPPLHGAPRLPSVEPAQNYTVDGLPHVAGAGAGTGASFTRSMDGTGNLNLISSSGEMGTESLLEVSNPNLPAALLAVANVISAWECEVRRTGDSCRQSVESQAHMMDQSDERWAGLHRRFDKLQAQVEQIDATIEANRAKGIEFEQWLQPMLQTSFKKIEENTRVYVEQAAKEVKEQSGTSRESIKAHVSNLLGGALDKNDDGHKSVGQQMKAMEIMLGGLSKNEERLRESANKWQQSTADAHSKVLTRLNETQSQVTLLTQESAELRESLELAQKALEKATHAPGCEVLSKLKTIETRGNLGINRQTGRIEFEKPIEFETPSPTDPMDAALSQPDVTTAMLADVAEISAIFKVPMALEVQMVPGKGGKGDFWEQVAQARANLLGAELSRCGVTPALLTISGSVAPKGVKLGSLFIQLDPGIFVAPPPSAGKGSGKSGSKSPKRR